MKKYILVMGLLITNCIYAQNNKITLSTGAPSGVSNVSGHVVGNAGSNSYYYWVVANFISGQGMISKSLQVNSAPNLSGSNYVAIQYNLVPGASSYDILRTTVGNVTVPCTCLLASGQTSGSYNDVGGSLSSYTLAPIGSTTANIVLNNTSFPTPRLLVDTPVNTVNFAYLPSASSVTGLTYLVTDSSSVSSCTAGGGSNTPALCWSNGSSYIALGGSGGGSSFTALTGDATSTATGGATTVLKINGVPISATTAGYLDPTSSVQTQLNNKAASNASTTVNGQTCALGSTCTISNGLISGLTTGIVPKAGSSTTLVDSPISDNGTTVTVTGRNVAVGTTVLSPTLGLTVGSLLGGVTLSSLTGLGKWSAGVPGIAASADITALWTGTCNSSTVLGGNGVCQSVSAAFSVVTPAANNTSGTFSFASPALFQVDKLYLGGTTGSSPVLDFSGTTARIRKSDQSGDQGFQVGNLSVTGVLTENAGGAMLWNTRAQMQSPADSVWQLNDSSAVHNFYLNISASTITSGFGSSPSITGNAASFTVTVGSGGSATTGVIGFGRNWVGIPQCAANNRTTILLVQAVPTVSQVTLNASTAFGAGDLIDVRCSYGN